MSRGFACGFLAVLICSAPFAEAQTAAPDPVAQTPTPQQPRAQQPTPQQPAQKPEDEQPPVFTEQVVVTAARVEQQLVNAPATVSVITSEVIQSTPATNYAELFRSVPGVNISQTSARDFNITMRSAASTLSTSQLALVDGRSIYLDFFGFIMWDLLPVNPNEIRQIEVIRGPASAVWGANAMNGVINFISKTPRELAGDSVTISFGAFDRSVHGSEAKAGKMFSINGTHAQAVNDRWAYKISAGGYTSDDFARPIGVIPGTNTPYPDFPNHGTTQPKFDGRVDYDPPGGTYKLTVAGGYAGTSGTIHTGIGPFDLDNDVGLGYATMRYSRGALKFNFFTNLLNGDASALLSVDQNGRPILFNFNTHTYDFELGNATTIGTRQVVSYGGNYRHNDFNLSIAPRGKNRAEGGAYVQDEIFLNNTLRFNVGARVDKFDVIDDPVFSPRVAVIIKPVASHAIRVSYNKAFRSPSLINNFLDVGIIEPIELGRINPAFAPLGTFPIPVRAVGNEDLKQESIEAFEIGYTGNVRNRATISAAVYWTRNEDEIFFTQTARYRALSPPVGWLQALRILPPAQALGILEILPPACASPTAPCTTGGLPSEFSYRNLGVNRNKGFEIGIEGIAAEGLNVFANYSFQAKPDPDFDISEVNLPPTNRFNIGVNYNKDRFLGNASVSYVDEAFFHVVLEIRGATEPYTQVNGAFGVRWLDGKVTSSIKVINLANEEIQSHIFGDVIKRQVIGELRFQF